MPYVTSERREELNQLYMNLLKDTSMLSPGDLNYIISNLLNRYANSKEKFNYAVCNELIGVLECAKLELYTRLITPYEETKMKENGALYNVTQKEPKEPKETKEIKRSLGYGSVGLDVGEVKNLDGGAGSYPCYICGKFNPNHYCADKM